MTFLTGRLIGLPLGTALGVLAVALCAANHEPELHGEPVRVRVKGPGA